MDRKEYAKNYYLRNKDKMKAQSYLKFKEHHNDHIRDMIINKLNNDSYKRIPSSKIKLYNIYNVDGVYY